ncbi:MAG: FAD:protein FMN transferase [Candidatus Polarisedimenticolaceae bacterium]|nr:FAD:protein FMN transferase [Candidatus Polarisedimenticolaceae bacterium]
MMIILGHSCRIGYLFQPTFHKSVVRYIIVLLLLTNMPQANAAWVEKTAAVMGTHISVELWHPNEEQAEQLAQDVIDEMWRIDLLMSPFREESELSRINRLASQSPVSISQEMYQLLQKAVYFSRLSQGAFDITFASIGQLYDYRAAIHPEQAKIESLLSTIDFNHLLFDSTKRTVAFAIKGVQIDLGGIAKGHAVDGAIELLKRAGVAHALVTAGGDSRILGDRRGRPWHVAIRNPRDKNSTVVLLPLSDAAVSTSGDYERYFEAGGVRYHHIISPKTGQSPSQLRSVTIIGADATTTDALSTTLFIMGLKKGLALIETLTDIDAVIIDSSGTMHYSKGLAEPAP